MAESNPTQVILTDDGLKIINAQTTADEAVGNLKDINSDNKLTPSEKIKLKQEYDKDSKLYAIDISQLQSVGLPTTELETAMSNLTNFVTPLFEEMYITSNVNRDALNSVFTAFATADKNASSAFNDMISNAANDAKKAGDDAKEAGEKAQEAGEEAKASANQAQADAIKAKTDAATAQQKAQDSIDKLNEASTKFDGQITDAKNSAQKALDNITVVDSKVDKLSSSTMAQFNTLNNGYQEVISTVDNLKVGSRNLYLNSKLLKDGYGTNGSATVTVEPFDSNTNMWHIVAKQSTGKNVGIYLLNYGNGKMPNSSDWSYSADVKGTGKTTWFGIEVGNHKPIVGTIGSEWSRISQTGHFDNAEIKTIVMYFDTTSSPVDVYIKLPKLESGNMPTDWSPAPEDLATSTEFDQLSNAIKLKADSSDVTSQITVATKGIQSEVNNKVTDLNTKISQTSDAVQILATTGGQKNLVYNSSYANNAEGWNMFNGVGYLSNLAVSSYNGSPGFGVNVSGKGATAWTPFGESKHYTLPQPDAVATENTYSGSAMIKMYDDSDSTTHLSATLTYYDKNGARIGWKDMIVFYDSKNVWTKVKFENFPVPKGAYSIGMQYWAYGPKVHGMIAQPMIVFGPKIGPYNPDTVSQSDITASINNIHMGVKGADGSTSTFNMNNDTILLDANKIIINGNTSIQNGTIGTAKIANAAINTAQIADGAINNAKIANAAINDAKIANLNGNKIIAGSITSRQLNADDIIANVINGKTINGITINTPNLNLGTNGVLSEDWNLNQNTGWFEPKKGTGTTTLDMGVLRMSGNLSRWWDGSGSDQYWYGIGDNGDKIKNGSNSVTDDYAPGYEKHDIVGSNGVLLRSYLDATGLYLNQNSTKTVMVALTQKGLDTGGYIHAQQNSVVDQWFDAGVNTGTGIRIGYRAIQAHGSNDIYFNTDSAVGALTLHAKNFAASSQLSRKKDISPLEEEQAMETIMNTDIYRYHYKDETESEPYNYSVIIDDVHEKPQYKTPEEFIIADRTGRNDGNAVGFLIQALKNANRRISALEEIINERK